MTTAVGVDSSRTNLMELSGIAGTEPARPLHKGDCEAGNVQWGNIKAWYENWDISEKNKLCNHTFRYKYERLYKWKC